VEIGAYVGSWQSIRRKQEDLRKQSTQASDNILKARMSLTGAYINSNLSIKDFCKAYKVPIENFWKMIERIKKDASRELSHKLVLAAERKAFVNKEKLDVGLEKLIDDLAQGVLRPDGQRTPFNTLDYFRFKAEHNLSPSDDILTRIRQAAHGKRLPWDSYVHFKKMDEGNIFLALSPKEVYLSMKYYTQVPVSPDFPTGYKIWPMEDNKLALEYLEKNNIAINDATFGRAVEYYRSYGEMPKDIASSIPVTEPLRKQVAEAMNVLKKDTLF
ncbi:hypothetical protein, partial [Treponema sp. R6D11]